MKSIAFFFACIIAAPTIFTIFVCCSVFLYCLGKIREWWDAWHEAAPVVTTAAPQGHESMPHMLLKIGILAYLAILFISAINKARRNA